MPKLNSKGEALMGVAGFGGSIDGIPIPHPLLQCCWFTDRAVVGAKNEGGVYLWDRDGGDFRLLDTRPANELIAGGARWAGWNSRDGVFGSLGDRPTAALRGASPLALALCPSYGIGLGFETFAHDGTGTQNTWAAAQDLQCPNAQQVYWFDLVAGIIQSTPAVPQFTPSVPPRRLRWIPFAKADWLIYWAEGHGLIAQPSGSPWGWVLETEPIAFNHDAVATPEGIMVAWSTTQAERPEDLVKVLVNAGGFLVEHGSAPRAHYEPNVGSVPVPPRPQPPDPPKPEPPHPQPEPPKPQPEPPPPDYTVLRPYTGASMITKSIGLYGPGSKFCRLDSREFGHGPFGAYPVHFDRDTPGPDETFQLTETADGRFTIQHGITKTYFGADATEENKDICGQFTTHATSPGAYELWTVKRVRPGGTIIAFIEYERPGHPRYCSQSLTVIEL